MHVRTTIKMKLTYRNRNHVVKMLEQKKMIELVN